MKILILKFSVCLSLMFLVSNCTVETEHSKDLNLSVALLTNNPPCNHSKSAEIINSTPDSQSCIEYSFEPSAGKLTVKHLNTAFNCCPESLWCTVTYRNDTIIVQEYEKNMGCKCNCLYDLEMEVNGLEPGKYQLRLIEPYIGTQQPINVALDLQNQKTGSFCATRTNYPWGE